MQVLIVKLSSLGDVVHAMPVVHDIAAAHPGARIDWVVEPAFAPLVQRVDGVRRVIPFALRRWRRAWWTVAVRAEMGEFRRALQADRYDAVIDLQGLTKSAAVARLARGPSHGLRNRTDGSSWEWPARWLVDHPIRVEAHVHALDRSRVLCAAALHYSVQGPPRFCLRHASEAASRTVAFVHGTSRDDKLWPEAHWIELGRRLRQQDVHIALPQAGDVERARAERIAMAIGDGTEVWPAMDLGALSDKLGATHGVIGVDSGLSHIAVALGLPHVQIYNFPTAWRTGPQPAHGHRHQLSIEPVAGAPAPSVDAVWTAWLQVERQVEQASTHGL